MSQIYSPLIVDTFKYFPNLVESLPFEDTNGNIYSSEGYIVSDITAARIMGSHQGITRVSTYVKINEGANITQVTEELTDLYHYNNSISVSSVKKGINNLKDDPIISIVLLRFKIYAGHYNPCFDNCSLLLFFHHTRGKEKRDWNI